MNNFTILFFPKEHASGVGYQFEESPVLSIETFKEPKQKPWVQYPAVNPSAEVIRPIQYPSPIGPIGFSNNIQITGSY